MSRLTRLPMSAMWSMFLLLLLCPSVSNAQLAGSYGSGPDLTRARPNGGQNDFGDPWQRDHRPTDMASIQDLEVMCGKRHMEVKLTFDRPFNGLVFSKEK